MPATARCVVCPDDVVIHTVESDDRGEEKTGSTPDRATLRGVRCVVPPAADPRIQLRTPSESEFGTGTCTIRSDGRARYVLTITQERLE